MDDVEFVQRWIDTLSDERVWIKRAWCVDDRACMLGAARHRWIHGQGDAGVYIPRHLVQMLAEIVWPRVHKLYPDADATSHPLAVCTAFNDHEDTSYGDVICALRELQRRVSGRVISMNDLVAALDRAKTANPSPIQPVEPVKEQVLVTEVLTA